MNSLELLHSSACEAVEQSTGKTHNIFELHSHSLGNAAEVNPFNCGRSIHFLSHETDRSISAIKTEQLQGQQPSERMYTIYSTAPSRHSRGHMMQRTAYASGAGPAAGPSKSGTSAQSMLRGLSCLAGSLPSSSSSTTSLGPACRKLPGRYKDICGPCSAQ